MEILTNCDNRILKFTVKGRLDATTAPLFEEKIADLSDIDEVIIDVNDLEYISSAGLRVVLKIKHSVLNTSVINASTEVYDIFEMTGFSEMMKVSKKFREISVENCEVIGRGYYGTVYRVNKDTIVKTYSKEMPIDRIERERELARKAFVLGVPTAIPYDIVKVGDYYGSVFELLDAQTLQKYIINDMDHLDDHLRDYVKVLKVIHASEVKPGELTNKKEEALGWAKNVVTRLDKVTGDKLLKLISNIKDDNHMIHGDYHIKNIMVQNGEPFIIDMDTLAMGAAIFELGFMYSCYVGYQEVNRNNATDFFGLEQDVLERIYFRSLELYFEDKPQSYVDEVIKKCRIISYTQLIDRFIISKDHQAELELFIKEITELVSEIDDLNL